MPATEPSDPTAAGRRRYRRYVALGDSFTEGVGDPVPTSRNGLRGWADRVAGQLAAHDPPLRYANLAVRGRRMDDVLAEQLPLALTLDPDLVTVNAGLNDLLLWRTDLDEMMNRYADGLQLLAQTGATVLTFTAADLGDVPLFRRLRGRAAIYNELLRAVTDELGIRLVDFWRFPEFRETELWDSDRIHLSALGHEYMAGRVLDALGEDHRLASVADAASVLPRGAVTFRNNLEWTARFAVPWLGRRIRRMTPGAGVAPKTQTLIDLR